MAMPANVTTVVVLGTFLTPEGNPSTGTVSFTPSSWLTNSGANVAIPNSSVVKTLGTAGNFSVTLPITDDPDLNPEGWVYTVSEVVDGVSQSYNIAIPGTVAAGGTVFLADLAPVAPAGPEYYSLASSLAIGTVTTVATGGSATASITGLAPSQVLNLGIPVGATGTVASAGSGSVGTAAVAPQGDPDTGIYFPAANQVAITTGGSAAATFAAGAISNPTFTGVAAFPDGSAAAPSITNTGDTNTGLFHPAEDVVAISTGGTERVRVNASGQVGIGVSPGTDFDIQRSSQLTSRWRSAVDSNRGSLLYFDKARGSWSAPTTVQNSDITLEVYSRAHDGTQVRDIGAIQVLVDGVVATNDVPSRLTFSTRPAGVAAAVTERMRIDSNGLITGTGTSLGAWTAYTPTLGGTGWAIGDGTITGQYAQIGKMIVFRAYVVFGSTSTFGAGGLTVTMPITARGGAGITASFPITFRMFDASTSKFYAGIAKLNNTTTVALESFVASTTGEVTSVISSVPYTWASSDVIYLHGFYEAA